MKFSRRIGQALALVTLMPAIVASRPGLQAYSKEPASRAIAGQRSIPPQSVARADRATHALVNDAYGKLPLSFEANQGQFDSRVKFVSRADGLTVFLTATEAVLRLDANTEAVGTGQAFANPAGSLDQRTDRDPTNSTRQHDRNIRAARQP